MLLALSLRTLAKMDLVSRRTSSVTRSIASRDTPGHVSLRRPVAKIKKGRHSRCDHHEIDDARSIHISPCARYKRHHSLKTDDMHNLGVALDTDIDQNLTSKLMAGSEAKLWCY